MNKDFNKWFSDFTDTIASYSYYTDFNIAYRNIDKIKVELNIMNSLIGAKNIENDFDILYNKYPEIANCIPLLLAVRENQIKIVKNGIKTTYNFSNPKSADQLRLFMRESGLFDLISKKLTNNLVDYATGVEVGLGSNGRKSRGGKLMENLVEQYLIKAGFKKGKNYFKEIYLKDIEKNWKVDLSSISNKGKTSKRFDFVIKSKSNIIYAIETNFYATGGSKLNETARSYKNIAQESKNIKGFKFVWITDGYGWKNAKHNLEETFDVMDTIFNIKELENGTFLNSIQ